MLKSFSLSVSDKNTIFVSVFSVAIFIFIYTRISVKSRKRFPVIENFRFCFQPYLDRIQLDVVHLGFWQGSSSSFFDGFCWSPTKHLKSGAAPYYIMWDSGTVTLPARRWSRWSHKTQLHQLQLRLHPFCEELEPSQTGPYWIHLEGS